MAKNTQEATAQDAAAVQDAVQQYFSAANYPIRNPYTNVLYDQYGHYPIAEESGDSVNFINVQLAAGVLKLVEI